MKSIFYNDERKEEKAKEAKEAPKPKVIEEPQKSVKPPEPVKK